MRRKNKITRKRKRKRKGQNGRYKRTKIKYGGVAQSSKGGPGFVKRLINMFECYTKNKKECQEAEDECFWPKGSELDKIPFQGKGEITCKPVKKIKEPEPGLTDAPTVAAVPSVVGVPPGGITDKQREKDAKALQKSQGKDMKLQKKKYKRLKIIQKKLNERLKDKQKQLKDKQKQLEYKQKQLKDKQVQLDKQLDKQKQTQKQKKKKQQQQKKQQHKVEEKEAKKRKLHSKNKIKRTRKRLARRIHRTRKK